MLKRIIPLIILVLGGACTSPADRDRELLRQVVAGSEPGIAAALARGADPNTRDEFGYPAIVLAVRAGHAAIARRLRAAGADVDASFPNRPLDNRLNALYLAAIEGNRARVKLLLSLGADPNWQVETGATPLWPAVDTDRLDILDLLLAAGGDPNIRCDDGRTCLFMAHTPRMARRLIDHGADITVRSEHGNNVFHEIDDEIPLMQVYLDLGFDVDTRNDHGETPLMHKVRYNQPAQVDFLLDRGADINARSDSDGMLAYAAHAGLEMVRHLLARGLELHRPENDTILVTAASRKDPRLVRFFIEQGFPVNVVNPVGETPLLQGVFEPTGEVARLLLEHGADPNLSRPDGTTPLLLGCGYIPVMKQLLEHGADVNAADNEGQTPLIRVAEVTGSVPAGRLLLDFGADPSIRDIHGRTAGDYARQMGWSSPFWQQLAEQTQQPDESRILALADAAARGRTPRVRELLRAGVSPVAVPRRGPRRGVAPLMWAALTGQADTLQALLDAGVDPDTTSPTGLTPLMLAAAGGHAAAVDVLRQRGARLDARDREGRTAADYARAAGWAELASRLEGKK